MDVRISLSKNSCFDLLGPCAARLRRRGSDGDEPAADGEADIDVEFSGSVGDGPVANAQLKVRNKTGDVLQNAIGSQLAGYNIALKTKGKNYPLFIDATGGTDLVTNLTPDFTLAERGDRAAQPSQSRISNPFTTLARRDGATK